MAARMGEIEIITLSTPFDLIKWIEICIYFSLILYSFNTENRHNLSIGPISRVLSAEKFCLKQWVPYVSYRENEVLRIWIGPSDLGPFRRSVSLH